MGLFGKGKKKEEDDEYSKIYEEENSEYEDISDWQWKKKPKKTTWKDELQQELNSHVYNEGYDNVYSKVTQDKISCPTCGGEIVFINGRYRCRDCGAIYSKSELEYSEGTIFHTS